MGKIEDEAIAVCEAVRRGDRAAVIRAALYAGKLSKFSESNSTRFIRLVCDDLQITEDDLRRAGVPDAYFYRLGYGREADR